MVCFYEIIFKGGYLHAPEQTKLIQGDDFVEGIWEFSVKDATGKNITYLKEAEKFVVAPDEVLEVNELCDSELLEHLSEYYRVIE